MTATLAYRAPKAVHGTNPQFLIEKAIRSRIYDSLYWKSTCFTLSAETMVDVAALQLPCIGGSYGGTLKPTEFMCLMLKLLQLQPEEAILKEYLAAHEFKYLRALAAFYIRLVFPPMDIYTLLEPMLEDYRKLRYRNMDGSFRIIHMDEFVDELLNEERVCDIILPRLVKREVLEEKHGLPPRASMLEEALLEGDGDANGSEDDDDEAEREMKRRWRDKIARAKQAREARSKLAEESMLNGTRGENVEAEQSAAESEAGYPSQEDSDEDNRQEARYISRSPSRSLSPDRLGDAEDSRTSIPLDPPSPSRSASSASPQSQNGRYISRSPSAGSVSSKGS